MKTILSLGAGVQSSTMALMAKHGEITPMPDAAIFADVGAEPEHIYEYLDYLKGELPFPVHIVSAGNLREMILESCGDNKGKSRFAAAPFYVSTGGKREGMLRRQCTKEYKIAPITKEVRRLVGLEYRQRAPKGEILAEQWIGISLDEITRMKDPREHWLRHRWPLIEMKMTRLHCLQWMKDHGYRMPSKSACTFCPYRSDKDWYKMKMEDPESFADAVRIDEYIRAGATGMADRNNLYVHRSLEPLATVDLHSLSAEDQFDMFEDECDGMCGV